MKLLPSDPIQPSAPDGPDRLSRRRFLSVLGTGGALAALAGCSSASWLRQISNLERRPPNILWIMFDDGRADALGCYGRAWPRTPHMDSIAAQGVRFDVAIVQNPVCIPSRQSMKSGFYAHEVGPVAMGKPPVNPGRYIDEALMERLKTAPNLLDAWTAAGRPPQNAGKIHGFGRSWKQLGDFPPLVDGVGRPTATFIERYGENSPILDTEMVFTKTHRWLLGAVMDVRPEDTETGRIGELAVQTLEQLAVQDEPFFLRVAFHAPHVGCYVPREFFIDPQTIDLPVPTEEELADKPKFEQGPLRTYCGAELTPEQIGLARGTYYGMVSQADAQVGRMLEVLKRHGLLDHTLIAINSDQGFQLGEHGLWKKRVFYEQNVRVPLILSCPTLLPQGKVIDEPVEMIDFLPTMMDLAGVPVPDGIHGHSLRPLIEGRVRRWRKACFSEIDHSQSMYDELRQGTGRRVMVRTRRWKLIFFMDDRVADKDGALYDLQNDPGETRNLYRDPAQAGTVAELEALAAEWDRTKSMRA